MNFNDLDDNLIFDVPAKAEPKIDTNKLAIRSDITKVSDVLTEFDKISAGLADLAARYPHDLVYDVSTGKGMAEAIEHRRAWWTPLLDVERLRKDAKAPILALGKDIDARAKWLTEQLELGKKPVDQQIKAELARKEDEKQDRINAEFGRVQAIQDAIGEIHMQAMAAAGKASEVIFAASLHLAAMELDPLVFQEQIPQAEAARTAAIAKLEVAYKAALHSEAVTAKAAADRAELETLRAAAAAEQRRQDAAVIVQRAEQARIADQQRAEQAEIAALRKQLAEERAALDAAEAKRRQDEQGTRDAEALSDGRLGWKSVPAVLASNLPDAVTPQACAEPAVAAPDAPEPMADAVVPVAEIVAPVGRSDMGATADQLALAYARARVSMLGAGDHCATIEAALNALDGLPLAALIGGWTFKGFTAWARGLEEEIAMLKANIDSSPSPEEWNVLRATQCDCTTKIAADGVQVTFCSSAQMARARALGA